MPGAEKVSIDKIKEMEELFAASPSKKKKFDELAPVFPCLQEMMFLDIESSEIDFFRMKLERLPKYFTKDQFDKFIKEENIVDHIKTYVDKPKLGITLTIYSQEWMVDKNGNILYCNPQIGNTRGKLAELDDNKWCDF